MQFQFETFYPFKYTQFFNSKFQASPNFSNFLIDCAFGNVSIVGDSEENQQYCNSEWFGTSFILKVLESK